MAIDFGLERDISRFLEKESTVATMIDASKRGRPAVEAIDQHLLDCFGNRVRPNKTRQHIGRLIRPLLEAKGYVPAKRRQSARSVLFTSGTVYSRPIMAILGSHSIDLPSKETSQRIQLAIDKVVRMSHPAMLKTHFAWSRQSRIAEVPPTPTEPLHRFAAAIEQTLEQADARRESAIPDSQLTAKQISLLRLAAPPPKMATGPTERCVSTAFKYGALCATSLTVAESAHLLPHQRNRWIQTCITKRRLYSLAPTGHAAHVLPIFQFGNPGHLVPHVTSVFPQLDEAIHPVGVFNWFTSPNPDLSSPATGFEPLSPRDWLLREHPPDPVTQLAATLAVGNPA